MWGNTKKPNLFIIGAPKCGTTALHKYFSEHPQIFMSNPKEPHFFSTELSLGQCHTDKAYEDCFNGALSKHIIIGEASTWYLYSKNAVPNILKFNPEAKFIVMIRDPINLAYSLHSENYFQGDENIKNFEKAWDMQGKRLEGKGIPRLCKDRILLQYGEIAKLGEQIERLFSHISRKQLFIIEFNDFKSNTEKVYREVINFLGIEQDSRKSFEPQNINKAARLDVIRKIRHIGLNFKRYFDIKHSFGILNKIVLINTTKKKRPLLSENFIDRLINYFSKDIIKLSKITGYDLSPWLTKKYYDYKK